MREILLDPRKRKLLLGGISGVGKTRILGELQSRLSDCKEVLLSVEITSPAQRPVEVVQLLSAQLARSASVQGASLAQYVSELGKRPIRNAYRLGLALLGDVVKSKLSSAEGTVKEAAAILSEADDAASADAQAQALSEAGKDDLVLAFRELLATIAENGQRGSLVIDGLENASTTVVETVLALVADLPESWCISLAVNTERTEGPGVFSKLSELLVYSGGEVLELRGLGREGLSSWMNYYNPAGHLKEKIDEALVVTQGRPLYLESWLSGTGLDQVTLALGKRIAPAYRARFNDLSPQAQAYLARICVLPPGLSDIPAVSAALVLGIPQFNAVAVMNELKVSRFLEEGVAGSLRPHDEIRQQVNGILGDARRIVAQEILREIHGLGTRITSRDADLLKLSADAGQTQVVLNEGGGVAAKLVESSPEAAVQTYELISESHAEEIVDEQHSDLLLNRAKALIGVGKYSAAIEFVDQADIALSKKELVLKSSQIRLKALLRLNRYSDAKSVADHILGLLPKAAYNEYIETLRIVNTIHRDVGDTDNAISTAKELKKVSKKHYMDDRDASRVWRSLARTYAIFRPKKSVRAGEEALRRAEGSGVLRDIGNAYLAMGEAQRHVYRFNKAIRAYEKAIKCALALGNVDSLLWSVLGKADAEMLSGDCLAAKQSLVQLEPFFSDQGRRHPLEAIHWRLSQLELEVLLENGNTGEVASELLNDYTKLGILWPRDYIESLLRSGKTQPKPI